MAPARTYVLGEPRAGPRHRQSGTLTRRAAPHVPCVGASTHPSSPPVLEHHHLTRTLSSGPRTLTPSEHTHHLARTRPRPALSSRTRARAVTTLPRALINAAGRIGRGGARAFDPPRPVAWMGDGFVSVACIRRTNKQRCNRSPRRPA